MNINWYPGHMTKAKRQLEDKIKLIDVVVEVVDARAPLATRNPDFEPLFKNKARLIILNKCDMANRLITDEWERYFKNGGLDAVKYSVISGNPKQVIKAIEKVSEPIAAKYLEKGRNKVIRCIVAGVPNVGKSAILNSLTGTKTVQVGNKPGVTRGLQWVKLTPYLELMDSPGLLWPKIDDERAGAVIALIGSMKTDFLDEEELAYQLLSMLREAAPEAIMDRYKLKSVSGEPWDIMGEICKSRGFLLKGGEYSYERGAKMLLDEFKNGKLGKISLERVSND